MNSLQTKRIAVIGAGNIGWILFNRLLASGVPVENLVICDSDERRACAIAGKFGVCLISLSDKAACTADAVLLAVPPKAVPDLLGTVGKWLRPGQLVISFAAAIPLEWLESWLPAKVMVVSVMPNAPSIVGQRMNPVAYGRRSGFDLCCP